MRRTITRRVTSRVLSIPPQNDSASRSENKKNDFPMNLDGIVRRSIKKLVDDTNLALASMQCATESTSSSVLSRTTSFGNQLRPFFRRAMSVYATREDYGPMIIAGSVTTVGGLMVLRRGKFPGAFFGSVAGFGSYIGVYGIDVDDVKRKVRWDSDSKGN